MAWTQIIEKTPEVMEETSAIPEALEPKEDCLLILKDICCTLKEIHSMLISEKEESENEIIINERK